MAMIDLTAVGLVARHRLAVPTTELSANGWPSAPVRGSPARRPPRGDLRPAWRGLGPCPLAGLGDGLTGDGARQSEAPGLPGGLRAGRARRLRARVHVVRMCAPGADGRRDEGGMPAGLQRAGPVRVARVQAGDGLLPPDAEFPLPAHAVQGSDLPRPEPWGEMRQDTAVPRRGVHPDGARRPCGAAPTARPIGGHAPAIEEPALRLQPPVAVGPWEALRRDLPAPHVVHRRLPGLLPAAETGHAWGAAGPPALQTGRGEIGAQGFCRKVRFWGKIQKSGVRNSMAYRCQHSRKSNFATEPSTEPRDMRLPGLNLHPLGGDRVGEWAVSVSGNWRVTFRFEGTDAVSVNYEDYP